VSSSAASLAPSIHPSVRRSEPLVIVGMGGSGEGVVAALLSRAGVYLGPAHSSGSLLTHPPSGYDLRAEAFVEFDYRWAPAFVAGEPLTSEELARADREHEECCERHCANRSDPSGPWGWQHCASIHLLELLAGRFAGLRIVHVVRDGRALTSARGEARRHVGRLGAAVLDGDQRPVAPGSPGWRVRQRDDRDATPSARRHAQFWSVVNETAAALGETRLKHAYLRVRSEDLREQPSRELRRLLSFAGVRASVEELVAALPQGQPCDAWDRHTQAERALLESLMGRQLHRFGYAAQHEPGDAALERSPAVFAPRVTAATPSAALPHRATPDAPLGAAPSRSGATLECVDWSTFDFIDLGCSLGGSLSHCARRMNVRRGIGIDNDPLKVAGAREAGHEAVLGDATDLRLHSVVSFVSMMDFLEHLPDLETVRAVIAAAAAAATDFLFIRHPSFEEEEATCEMGLRQYWWNWTNHTAHVRCSDYRAIFADLGLHRYTIHHRGEVNDSDDASVHPIDAIDPAGWFNQGAYDAAVHPPKPSIRFAAPLRRAQDILVALRPFSDAEWSLVESRLLGR
jgi:hypothetical protein